MVNKHIWKHLFVDLVQTRLSCFLSGLQTRLGRSLISREGRTQVNSCLLYRGKMKATCLRVTVSSFYSSKYTDARWLSGMKAYTLLVSGLNANVWVPGSVRTVWSRLMDIASMTSITPGSPIAT